MTILTEGDVAHAALAWLSDLGWQVPHGPAIAPDAPALDSNLCLFRPCLGQQYRTFPSTSSPPSPHDTLHLTPIPTTC